MFPGQNGNPAIPPNCLKCEKCPLAPTRTQVVFGVGNENADILFVCHKEIGSD